MFLSVFVVQLAHFASQLTNLDRVYLLWFLLFLVFLVAFFVSLVSVLVHVVDEVFLASDLELLLLDGFVKHAEAVLLLV
jgi:hypothetical protein